MDRWLGQLGEELTELHRRHLLRSLRVVHSEGRVVQVQGQPLVNLASNDYLGLSHHPQLIEAATRAIQQHGTGGGASRLITGHQPPHAALEQRFAKFKHAQAALLCPTGYMANLAVLTSLADKGDLICMDKLCHASLIDAAQACSARGCQVRVFPHRNLDKLRRLLEAPPRTSRDNSHREPRKLIVTDSVFSMDGDVADLPAICDLADEFDAILIVDEAHGTGVLGRTGAGLSELQNVTNRVDVVISTASKALGSLGGIVTAPRVVIDTLVNKARSFIYTTAVPAAQAATIDAALDIVEREPQRRQRLLELSRQVRDELMRMKLLEQTSEPATPIIPIIVGKPERALALSEHLQGCGFFAPAIRPPTVAPGSARVRLSLRADLSDEDVTRLIDALKHRES